MMFFNNKKKNNSQKWRNAELRPDEILLDVSNLPSFNQQQFEGRLEKPISKYTINLLLYLIIFVLVLFVTRLFFLQFINYDFYLTRSEKNNLKHTPLIADRGIIYDRNGVELAWNESLSNE